MRRLRHLLIAFSLTAAIGPSLIAQPAPPRLRLVEDYRLDATAEDFPTVGPIWVGPKSQLVVPIRQDMQLRIYDAAGKRIAVTGRSGSGPGEFRSMGIVGWKADTIWVSDGSQRRVTYLAPDGKLIRSTAFPTLEGAQIAGTTSIPSSSVRREFSFPSAFYPDGSVLLQAAREGDGSALEAAFGGPPLLVRMATDGNARVLLQMPTYADERWGMAVSGFGTGVPFAAVPMSAISTTGDRIAHMTSEVTSSRGGTFTVSHFRANGDTVYVRTFPFTGVPVSAASRDSALAALLPRPGRPTEGPAISRNASRTSRESACLPCTPASPRSRSAPMRASGSCSARRRRAPR